MKKLFAFLMVCGFALAFVACGGGGTQTEDAQDTTSTTAPAETEPTESDTTQNADTTAVN